MAEAGKKIMPYECFSGVYEQLMDNVPYEMWCDRIHDILVSNGIKDGLVLDLCCGTGSMTRRMAGRGYDMIGIDSSQEMLAQAAAKNDDNKILYLCQNAEEFELYGTVKAVICVCDSINYILEKDKLVRLFKNVNNYLEAGGIFIFDINTEYKFMKVLGDGCIAENRFGVSYIWNNFYDVEEKINEYELTLFIEREDGLYEKQVEYHYERAYSIDEIKDCINAAGMELLGIYNGYEDEKGYEDDEKGYRDKKGYEDDENGYGEDEKDGNGKAVSKKGNMRKKEIEESERVLFVVRERFQEGKLYTL